MAKQVQRHGVDPYLMMPTVLNGPQRGAPLLQGRSIATRLHSVASFYAALAVAAFFWHGASQDTNDIWHVDAAQGLDVQAATLGLGIVSGLLIVRAFRWLEPRHRWLQALRTEFRDVLGPLSSSERLVLAAASAIGEELMFRGAMLDNWGLVASTLVFGLIHVPPRWSLWPWTASSLVLGLVLGLLTLATGNLGAAVATHFVINFLNLGHISRRDEPNTPQPSAVPSPTQPPAFPTGHDESPQTAPKPTPTGDP